MRNRSCIVSMALLGVFNRSGRSKNMICGLSSTWKQRLVIYSILHLHACRVKCNSIQTTSENNLNAQDFSNPYFLTEDNKRIPIIKLAFYL